MDPMTIVCGVDGGEESLAALTWARRAAGPDGVVEAVLVVSRHGERTHSAPDLARWIPDDDGDTAPTVHRRLVEGRTADALLDHAREVDADMVVVGVHGRPRISPRTLGRVTTQLVRHADRPLVVVGPGPDHAVEFADASTVVGGVDTGPATPAALHWAAEFAERHDTALTLIHAVGSRPVFSRDGILEVMAFYVDRSLLQDWALDDLAELADELQRATEEDVPITWSAPVGKPGPALVEAGADAALIVVGRDCDGASDDRRIGPAMHHVLTHAPCPVVVVPTPADG